jgi:hypothetical protein
MTLTLVINFAGSLSTESDQAPVCFLSSLFGTGQKLNADVNNYGDEFVKKPFLSLYSKLLPPAKSFVADYK